MAPDSPSPVVRIVGKPLAPPFNDSSKNLARDLVRGAGDRVRFRVFGVRGVDPGLPSTQVETLTARPGGLGSSLALQARVFRRLLLPEPSLDVLHFFFSPSPRTAAAARALLRLRRCATVQTVVSQPLKPRRSLYFADRIVVLSEARRTELIAQGVAAVQVIRPGIADPAPVDEGRRAVARETLGLGPAPLVLFPGDWEFGAGWAALLECWTAVRARVPDARLVLACREKSAASRPAREAAMLRAREQGWDTELVLAGEVTDMPALLAAADVVALPAESLRAKADLPLVLLEALALGRAVVVSDLPELRELAAGGRAARVAEGARPDELARCLVEILREPATRAALGAAGREHFLAHHAAAGMAEQYVTLYHELCRKDEG